MMKLGLFFLSIIRISGGVLSENPTTSRPPLTTRDHRIFQETAVPSCGWTQVFSDLQGRFAGDQFGAGPAFSDDGTTIAVGSRFSDGPLRQQEDIGEVRVFTSNGTDLVQLGNILYGAETGENFGVSVSLSSDGRALAVGAFRAENDRGRAYVYRYTDELEDWQQVGQELSGTVGNSLFGGSVSLSGDGSIVAVGAIAANSFAGEVHVFQLQTMTTLVMEDFGQNFTNATAGSNTSAVEEWQPMGQILRGSLPSDLFGFSVSLSRRDGNTVAVGIVGSDVTSINSGQVIVFRFNNESTPMEWEQLGGTIDGLPMDDGSFGGTVTLSSDGSTVAAGAAGDEEPFRGYARVFVFDGANWIQLGGNIIGENDGDRAGHGVALLSDGRTIAVGSTLHDGLNGVDSGHVRVFQYQNNVGEWVRIGAAIEGAAVEDQFGRRIALVASEGNGGVIQLLIGSHFNDANGRDSGLVRWFTIESDCVAAWLDSTSNTRQPTLAPTPSPTLDPLSCAWTQMGNDLFGKGVAENFGTVVTISGDGKTIAVGGSASLVSFVDGEQVVTFPGVVRVYSLYDDNTIGPQIGSDIYGDGPRDGAGRVFDMSRDGRTLVIGAPAAGTLFSGQVRLYRYRRPPDDWIQMGGDFLSNQERTSYGASVSLSSDGEVVAIGEPVLLSTDIPGGRVQVFRVREAPEQLGDDIFGNELNDEAILSDARFGSSVALSDDGTILAVGAFQSDIGGEMSGRVHLFQYDVMNGWTRFGNAIDGQNELEGFGYRLSMSSDGRTIAVVSRPQSTSNLGIIRVYNLSSDLLWTQIGVDINGEGTGLVAGRDSGLAVSLSDNGLLLAVGSPGAFGETGNARVFRFQPTVADWVLVGSEIPGDKSGDQFGSAVAVLTMPSRSVVAVGGRFNDQNQIDAGHVRMFSIRSSCIEEEVDFVAVEARFDKISINITGISELLDSNGRNVFEEVTARWFDDYFLNNVPAVRGMMSTISFREQEINVDEFNKSSFPQLTILYSQRMSYLISSGFNASAEALVVLPFADLEAIEDYLGLLEARNTMFAEAILPIEPPIIVLPVEPPPVLKESGENFSTAIIAGIVVGAFVFVLLGAFVYFRAYKANLPIAIGEEVVEEGEDRTELSTPIAYRVEPQFETDPVENENDGERYSSAKEAPDFKDQVRHYRPGDAQSASTHGNDSQNKSMTSQEGVRRGPNYKDQVRANRTTATDIFPNSHVFIPDPKDEGGAHPYDDTASGSLDVAPPPMHGQKQPLCWISTQSRNIHVYVHPNLCKSSQPMKITKIVKQIRL